MNDTMNTIISHATERDPVYQLCQVFSAIIAESGPIPFEDDQSWGYDGRPQKFQTPTSNRTRPPAFPSPTVAYKDISEDMLVRHTAPSASSSSQEASAYVFIPGDKIPLHIRQQLELASRAPIVPHA